MTGTAAGIGAMLLPSVSASAMGVALLGCGSRGMAHMDVLAAYPEARIRAICDRHDARLRLASAYTGGTPCVDWQEAVHRADVDAVLIALPEEVAVEAARQACAIGKPVALSFPRHGASSILAPLGGVPGAKVAFLPETIPGDWVSLRKALATDRLGKPAWVQLRYGPEHNLLEILTVLRETMALESAPRIAALEHNADGRFHATIEYDNGLTMALLRDRACVHPRITLRAEGGSAFWHNGSLFVHGIRTDQDQPAGWSSGLLAADGAAAAWITALRCGETPLCTLAATRATQAMLAGLSPATHGTKPV